jgi:hypothetical protein
MRRRLNRRLASLAVCAAIVLAAASAALAHWTTTGGGSGSGTTGNTQAIALSPGTPTAPLYPGGQGDVAVKVDNPNPFRVEIGTLSLSTGQGTAGYQVDAGNAGCATSALSFTTQTNGGAGWFVPPRVGSTDGSLSLDLPNALTMSAGAANACQGATFNVYLTAGP